MHILLLIGHDCLFKNRTEMCRNGKTAEFNYENALQQSYLIELQGFEVRNFWECEVEAMLQKDKEMRNFYSTIENTSVVLNLRDAFSGGRVGPFSLKCDLTETPGALEKYHIKYFDIVSLYPFTNYNCEV